MNFTSALLTLAFLCHISEATDAAEDKNQTQLGPVLFPGEENESDSVPTTETNLDEERSSLRKTAKKIFFFGGTGNYSDSIVVEANFTGSNDSFGTGRGGVNHQNLSPETDKSDLYVSQHYAADPEIETDDGKKLPHFSLGSFIPSLPNPLTKLPDWLKKKVVVKKTVYVKETLHSVVYPSCVLLQNVHSICDGELITVVPTTPMPTASIWSNFGEDREMTESLANKGNIKPSVTATAVLPTSTGSTADADEFYYDRQIGGTDHPDFDDENTAEESSTTITPVLSKKLDTIENYASDVDGKSGLGSLLKPEIQFVTEYKTITSTNYVVDYDHTATVIAENCLPANLNVPFCQSHPFEIRPTFTIYSSRTESPEASQTIDESRKETVVQSPTTKTVWKTETVEPLSTEGASEKTAFYATPSAPAGNLHIESGSAIRHVLLNNAIDRIRQKVRIIARDDLQKLVAGSHYGDILHQITYPQYADSYPQITYPISGSFLVPNYYR